MAGNLHEEASPRPPATGGSGWTAGRVIALATGSVLLLVSLALIAGGGALTWADRRRRRAVPHRRQLHDGGRLRWPRRHRPSGDRGPRRPARRAALGRAVGAVTMAWFLVIVAGVFEMGFAVLLKQSHGITRIWPTAGFAACALVSFGLLTYALKRLEVGPAYAVWTGIGAAGTAVIGMAVLGESVSTLKLVSLGLILAGVIGLNLAGVTPP